MHEAIKCFHSAWSNSHLDAINIVMTFLRNLRVRRMPGQLTRGIINADGKTIYCALGRGGPSVLKREGDGSTPANRVLKPICGFFRHDRVIRPASGIDFDIIDTGDGWCDDAGNANYNMPVKLPFGASHEVMTRSDQLYDIGVVLDWNMPSTGRQRNRGSAIFMHICKPGYQPTEGCIALKEADLRWLLKHIDNQTRIIVSR